MALSDLFGLGAANPGGHLHGFIERDAEHLARLHPLLRTRVR